MRTTLPPSSEIEDPLQIEIAEHVDAKARGLEQALEGLEEILGPVLDKALFPNGAPARVRPADLAPALARWLRGTISPGIAVRGSSVDRGERREDSGIAASIDRVERQLQAADDRDGIDALVFPGGVPPRLDMIALLRALRGAAARERRGLRDALDGDQGSPPGVAGRVLRVARLWRIACTWHAVAARHVDPRAASLLEALVTHWRSIERAVEKAFLSAPHAA